MVGRFTIHLPPVNAQIGDVRTVQAMPSSPLSSRGEVCTLSVKQPQRNVSIRFLRWSTRTLSAGDEGMILVRAAVHRDRLEGAR